MIKIEIEAVSLAVLKEKLKIILGEESFTNITTHTPVAFTEPDAHISDNNVEDDEQDEEVVSVSDTLPKLKRSRTKKVTATPVAATPAPVASPVPEAAPALPTETPQHFYSLNEFQANMAMIITELLSVGALDQIYLNICSNMVGEHFIYAAAKHPQKVEQIYEKMISDGIITRKGNY